MDSEILQYALRYAAFGWSVIPLRGKIAFTANGVFFVGFLAIKKAIPLTIPFAWDESFMELDRVLHLGRLPHLATLSSDNLKAAFTDAIDMDLLLKDAAE